METETSVQTAKRLKSEGYSYRSIGKMLGIGKTTARDWVSGAVKAPKTATISLEIPIPFIKTRQDIQEESEDLKEFIYYIIYDNLTFEIFFEVSESETMMYFNDVF